MRANRRCHVVQISSRLGIAVTSGFSFYAASKFALEGTTEALATELSPFQIKVTIVEPRPLRTDFFGRSAVFVQKEIEEYHSVLGNIKVISQQRHGKQDDDPIKAAKVIVAVTKMEQPPLRLPLTMATVQAMQQKINEYKSIIDQWETTALSTKMEQNT